MAVKDYSLLSREELVSLLLKHDQKKQYGIVWDEERVPEKVVANCQTHLPVLREIKEKAITANPNQLTHLLIEGDNYHTLSVLNYTHTGKIDLIYIDPPYNTGNKDFIYNDKYIDSLDEFGDSKWLNFMSKRLELAINLLTDEGVIFISIDDNEVAPLKMLCDKVFGKKNFVACLPTIMNLKGNQDQFGFAGTHEYTLVYCKSKLLLKLNEFEIEDESIEDWEEDEIGLFKKGANLKSTGGNAPRTKRPYLFFPILIHNESKEVAQIEKSEYQKIYDKTTKSFDDDFVEKLRVVYENNGYSFILPVTNNENMSWRWGYDKTIKDKYDIIITGEIGSFGIYKKQRPSIGDIPSKKPKTLFYKPEYSSGNGTGQLKSMFGDKIFNNPKPVDLIKDFLKIGIHKNALILDFFAGSGTTAQAVLELNQEDGGHRQFILATNNENNNGTGKILDDVCYPRIEKVIKGYQNNKGVQIEGLGGRLKYFKTSFVENNSNRDQVKIAITQRCTEMLCIKEGIYDLKKEGTNWKIFENNDRFLAVYYDFEKLNLNKLKTEMNKLSGEKVLYCFTFQDKLKKIEFNTWDNIRLEAIPNKILEVYKEIFKLSDANK